jgi:hypothetical protein
MVAATRETVVIMFSEVTGADLRAAREAKGVGRLVESASTEPKHNGRKTLYISMLDDVVNDYERFFVATEQAAVVLLPSAHSPGNFDTGLVVHEVSYVHALMEHGKALYGKHRLETVEAVDQLPVLR